VASPDDLHILATAFLAECVDALDSIPTLVPGQGLIGAPERRFVSPGLPVWDCCEQLAVHASPMSEADTTPSGLDAGRRSARQARINHASFIATITRCVPTGELTTAGEIVVPEAVDLSLAARQINNDGWALWNRLFNAVYAGRLLTLCDEVFWDGIIPVVPAGGCAGWTVSMRASLGGYPEILGT
jgi:hypothetical protein